MTLNGPKVFSNELYRLLAGDCSEENEQALTTDYDANADYPGEHPALDSDLLSRWENNSLKDHEALHLHEHLNVCPFCRKILFHQVAQRIYDLPQIFSREELRE